MKNRLHILFVAFCLFTFYGNAQNNTFSPYSRYGVGELAEKTLAHNAGMGGNFIAHKPDSTMPNFLNIGNPAALALVRLTTLEVGGRFLYSDFKGANNSSLTKYTTNFAYGALGFPIRGNGGASFGIMPYSFVGYDTKSESAVQGVGNVSSLYSGTGGLNKVFLAYGVSPFNKRLTKYRTRKLYIADSLKTKSHFQYKLGEFGSKILSDLSLGINANYIFGSIHNSSRVVYPNSLLYNHTFVERQINMGDFTATFGAQTAISIDSIKDSKKRLNIISAKIEALKTEGIYTDEQLNMKRDSLNKVTKAYRRVLKEKVKISFGYIGGLQNPMKVNYSHSAFSYVLGATGQEIIRDTILYSIDQRSTISLPFEQGFGIGIKKGERLNMVMDFAITDWQNFTYLENKTDLLRNYRIGAGINIVPEKYAAGSGAFFRRVNYRFGVSYQTGYIRVQDAVVSDYFASFGIGLPVGIGRLSSMVNISAQVGQMGSNNTQLLKQNYFRINFGFTFCDKWFQKYRYD